MSEEKGSQDVTRKRNRFILDDDGIVITGRRVPSQGELDEAGRVFDRILKNRKHT